jgi:hypothetical protein
MSPVAATWGTDSMQLNTSHYENPITFLPFPPPRAFEPARSSHSGEMFDIASNPDHGSVGSIGSMNSVGSIISWRGVSPPPDLELNQYYPEAPDSRPFGLYTTPSPPGTPPSTFSSPGLQCNPGEQQGEPQGMQISEAQLSEGSVSKVVSY